MIRSLGFSLLLLLLPVQAFATFQRAPQLATDLKTTTDATPLPAGVFEFPDDSSGIMEVEVVALRADGRTKAWRFLSLIKKIDGVLTVEENQPNVPNVFVSTADTIPMTGVTITVYSDPTYVGVVLTGQAGQTIQWIIRIEGEALSPT